MTTTMQLIAKQTVGASGTNTVTFSNIPQTFTDLKMVISSRSSSSYEQSNALVTFNGETSRYYEKLLYSFNTTVGSAPRLDGYPYLTWLGNTSGTAITSGVFSNSEFYISNYTSTNPKSITADGVNANNGAVAWTMHVAAMWDRPTANVPITSITLTGEGGILFTENSTFTLYGISNNTTTQATTVPYASGGDVITTDGSYWYHAFKYSGSFTPLKNLTADVLVVAGGGGGGTGVAGGGGAGGLLTFTAQALSANTGLTCTVGAGGAGSATDTGTNGGNSQFGSLTTTIGGGASRYPTPQDGGSGAGAHGGDTTARSGGSPTSGQGNAGGATSASGSNGAGGGGGAGAAGASVSGSTSGGVGGIGFYNSLTDSMGVATATGQLSSGHYYYAGGGGGAARQTGYAGGGGGIGGGGNGEANGNLTQTAGTANTGGGGGGGSNTGNAGKQGGSGIIIVRYAV